MTVWMRLRTRLSIRRKLCARRKEIENIRFVDE